jgi:signal transduction histidine kinase/ActR/RegA family two-component response regulator
LSSADQDIRGAARALAGIAHALAAADDADKRLRTTLKLVGQMVPYACCALLEVMPKNGRCEIYAVPELSANDSASLRSRLLALLRLLGVEQGDGVPELDNGDGDSSAAHASDRMHLAIPVIGLSQIIGVLFVEQTTEPFEEPYDEHSLRLLSIVAAQIGSYLTTLRLREEELEHARQLGIALRRLQETDRRKDDFLALLGHELRNPIGAINNALRIIGDGVDIDKSRYHKLIDRQIRHLSRIVDDLLDASRVRLGKVTLDRQIIDLRDVAKRWLEAFGTSAPVQSHEVSLSLSDEPVCVDGDPIRLEQTFSNLMTNALKYTPAGGQIVATVEAADGEGVVRVRDTGIGMTREQLSTIFELFTQGDESLSRSQGGLGLGLPLVRSLVEMHDGRVEAFSEGLAHGSEFIVRLPLVAAAPVAVRPAPTFVRRRAAGSLAILVVEDNEDACETLKEMLGIWGHEVDVAADGVAGLARALDRSFDVMLVDIGLPKLDGYEVARRARSELGAHTPLLIAMTGYGQPEDRRRAMDAGFDVYTVKPINAFELQQRLDSVEPRRTSRE